MSLDLESSVRIRDDRIEIVITIGGEINGEYQNGITFIDIPIDAITDKIIQRIKDKALSR